MDEQTLGRQLGRLVKKVSCKARDVLTNAGVHQQYVEVSQASATPQVAFFTSLPYFWQDGQ